MYKIDTIYFCISNIILLYWIYKQAISRKEKNIYAMLFLIFNSSYNIVIKRVQNYNLVIPRTFIYKFKIIGPISVLDILFLMLTVAIFSKIIPALKRYRDVKRYLYRDVAVYIISTVAYVFNKGYWLDGGRSFFAYSKGWMYSIVIITLVATYCVSQIDFTIPFFIILINGWLSTLSFSIHDITVRYGNKAAIIDQEDAISISVFLIIYLLMKVIYCSKNRKRNIIILCVVLVQQVLCVYKTSIVYLALGIFICFCVNIKGIRILIFALSPSLLCGLVILGNRLVSIFTSMAISTRLIQFTDSLSYMLNKGALAVLFGLGLTTPYYSTASVGDMGERKAIDLQNQYAAFWRTNIQTPIISTFKDSGIIGVAIYIIVTLIITIKLITYLRMLVIKIRKTNDKNMKNVIVETMSILVYMLLTGTFNYILYGATTPNVLFNAFMVVKCARNMEKINENINIY